MKRLILVLFWSSSLSRSFAQEAPPLPSDSRVPMTANQIAEARQADEYFKASNYMEALPLYEDLAKKVPMKAVYAERLAVCLINKAGVLPAGPEKDAVVLRYISELKRAKSLGDNSDLVQIMLDRIGNAKIVPSVNAPKSDAAKQMESAGVAFAKGDMEIALAGYIAAFVADPKLYDAPLFAGDVYFRQKNYQEAGEWFQKAITVNPNRETGYRYWADALVAAGDMGTAGDKYIDALVAEPYAKAPGLAFQRWAKKSGVTLARPSVPETKPADPAQDSLAAATARLKAMLPNPDLSDLTRLAAADMLEPYLLLTAADNGIARDYLAYRDAHREQLRAYLRTFVIRTGVVAVGIPIAQHPPHKTVRALQRIVCGAPHTMRYVASKIMWRQAGNRLALIALTWAGVT